MVEFGLKWADCSMEAYFNNAFIAVKIRIIKNKISTI